MQKQRDDIFTHDINAKFEFNDTVASVFDDMIERSIPFYNEIMNLAIYFILKHIESLSDEIVIYDIGSSTGNVLINLSDNLSFRNLNAKLIGIDNSSSMIKLAEKKAIAMGYDISFLCEDILQSTLLPSHVVSAFYTMQFIRPLQRQNLVNKIYQSLHRHGIFLFAEKIISQDSKLESQMIECYYEYKGRQGYSQSEIYKKREALENVLVPYSVDENIEMMKKAGFCHIEILFKWVNFALFFARK